MTKLYWRRYFRVLHRDIGYLIFGTTIIFAVSGIALNHKEHWNSDYKVETATYKIDDFSFEDSNQKENIKALVTDILGSDEYRQHYMPNKETIRIFVDRGTITLNIAKHTAKLERIRPRPVFNQFNKLHLDVGGWWTWFSDIFSVALIITAMTGIVLLKGKQGITRRGGILTLIGIALPFALGFYYL